MQSQSALFRPVREGLVIGSRENPLDEKRGKGEIPGPREDHSTETRAEDAEIIRLCLDGDKESFRVLVERYQKRAFWVAFNLLGNAEEAKDVTQDAFVRAFRSLDRFDFSKNFYTWFYKIVTNLAIDRLRRRAVARQVGLEELGDSIASGEKPEKPLEQEETIKKVRKIINSLPEKFKVVITLRDIEGLSCKEIAPILGTTHATVRWRLHRARQMFREKWEREEKKRS